MSANTEMLTQRSESNQQPSNTNVNDMERLASALTGGALAMYGLRKGSLDGLVLAALGGAMVYRGVSGHCMVYERLGISTADGQSSGVKVEKSMTINKSPEELYQFWRNFENLPQFMKHLESVKTLDSGRSHWVAKAPLGQTVAWDAEITAERENEMIAWRSTAEADVQNTGSVRFRKAPGNRGTEVHVSLTYEPPAGKLGAMVAKLFGEEPSQQIGEDLHRFKQLMETGEVPTTEGQPSGREKQGDSETQTPPSAPATLPTKPVMRKKDLVMEASEESFPASDPPSWT